MMVSSPFADAPLFLSGGGTSSSVWACAVQNYTADTPIDCFLPSDSYSYDGVIPTKGVLASNDGAVYDQIFMAGGGSSSSVWGCAVKVTGGIDCFLTSDSYGNDGVIPIKGTLPGAAGEYSSLFMAGGSSSSVWGCAARSSGDGADCFLPTDAYSGQDGVIPIKGTFLFPTPTPSLQPTISSHPSHPPSSQPSAHPTISHSPTISPEPSISPTLSAASSIGAICSVVLVGVFTISFHFF